MWNALMQSFVPNGYLYILNISVIKKTKKQNLTVVVTVGNKKLETQTIVIYFNMELTDSILTN